MNQEVIQKLTERKLGLEQQLAVLENELREYSRKVSETQVSLLENRGELRGIVKILDQLKNES